MRLKITGKIIFYFSILSIIAVVNFYIQIQSNDYVQEQNQWVLHTYEVLDYSKSFIGHMKDSETGQRGYLLTLNPSYLEPFYDGVKNSQHNLEQLISLTEDNREQQIYLNELFEIMNQKNSELLQTIALAEEGNIEEAIEIVNSNIGKVQMDRIRMITDQVISEQERLLNLRTESLTEYSKNLTNLFLIELLLLLSANLLTAFLVNITIVKPLNIISNSILENNIDVIRNISVKHRDEIGLLADEFIKMDQNVKQKDTEKEKLISELKNALVEVKTLQGIIPICSYCHKIRDDEGAWNQLEHYIKQNSSAEFSHGICPDCYKKVIENELL